MSELPPAAADDPFTPVAVRSAAAQVADQIVAVLRDGRISQNDRLPPERILAAQLQVSRPTLREALAALELAGVVSTHRGRGTIVTAGPLQVANWGIEVLPTQMFEARLAIEPQLASLAATKRYPEDLEFLHQTGNEISETYERTGRYPNDLPLHRAIARAARNPILAEALEEALKYTESPRWNAMREQALAPVYTREGHLSELHHVIEHIDSGQADEAAKVWHSHLVRYRDELLTGLRKADESSA